MGEKKVTKKQEATKAKATGVKKKKPAKEGAVERDEKGRFAPGKSGNPGGRPKLSDEFRGYAEKAPAELWKIATDEETSKVLRSSILEWFTEMFYGKARQQVDLDADAKISGITEVKFEGELEKWSE